MKVVTTEGVHDLDGDDTNISNCLIDGMVVIDGLDVHVYTMNETQASIVLYELYKNIKDPKNEYITITVYDYDGESLYVVDVFEVRSFCLVPNILRYIIDDKD